MILWYSFPDTSADFPFAAFIYLGNGDIFFYLQTPTWEADNVSWMVLQWFEAERLFLIDGLCFNSLRPGDTYMCR